MLDIVTTTNLTNLTSSRRGKVRDIYDLGDQLVIIQTDRISAFDVVLPNGIPGKGNVLTALSEFWFEKTKDIIGNHLITADVSKYPKELQPDSDLLRGRSMLVLKALPIPVECVVRGYITGSGWRDYQSTGSVCGIDLPSGLVESQKLPEPIFTPATKAEQGEHDENISFDQMVEVLSGWTTDYDLPWGPLTLAHKLRDFSINLYQFGASYAAQAGIVLADTKFEFGLLPNNILILIDEIFTPDSSRFWPKDEYEPGRHQNSFDKQYVRDYLVEIGWNKQPPAPDLSREVILNTSKKYLEACNRITGREDTS